MKTKEEIKALEREIKEIKESLRIKTKLPDDYTGWLVHDFNTNWMVYCKDGHILYGFDGYGNWFFRKEPISYGFDPSERPATKEEVEQRLKAEAERRGFKNGVKFLGVVGYESDIAIEIGKHNSVGFMNDGFNIGLYCSDSWIYHNGKWAEIIEEPKLNNIAVENLTRETGKEIIRLFQKLGVDTGCLVGNCNKSEGCSSTYYGVINGWFDCYSIKHCQENNIKIITLDQLRELAGEKEKTFPRIMLVRDDDDDDWEKEEIQLFHNGLYWCYCYNHNDRMVGYKQFKEID